MHSSDRHLNVEWCAGPGTVNSHAVARTRVELWIRDLGLRGFFSTDYATANFT